jgi:hypothetical protein
MVIFIIWDNIRVFATPQQKVRFCLRFAAFQFEGAAAKAVTVTALVFLFALLLVWRSADPCGIALSSPSSDASVVGSI